MPRPLAGRTVVVTGASRGLGAAIATVLAGDAAAVELWYHREHASAARVASAITAAGGDATARMVDVTNRAAVSLAVAELVDRRGKVDGLVNNAGIMRRAAFLQITDQDWQDTLRTNITGYFLVSQLICRQMAERGSGSVVHIASTNDSVASANCTAYATSKGAVGMLTKQMALELGPLGIRTNAVSPGMVETDLNRRELADPAFRADALARVPLGQLSRPADVGATVAFLLSPAAAAINGCTVRVDGGRTVA